MTFTTLIAAVASMSAVAMTTDISANAQAFTTLSIAAPMAASLAASQTPSMRRRQAYAQRRTSTRIKPVELQETNTVNLKDAFKVRRGGLAFTLKVFRPKSLKEPTAAKGVRRIYSYRKEMRAMGKAMPGYPQPPKAVVAVKMSF